MPTAPASAPRKPIDLVKLPEDTSGPAVYVVRLPEPSRRFAWEIRRLSAIVLERSRGDFATADQARQTERPRSKP